VLNLIQWRVCPVNKVYLGKCGNGYFSSSGPLPFSSQQHSKGQLLVCAGKLLYYRMEIMTFVKWTLHRSLKLLKFRFSWQNAAKPPADIMAENSMVYRVFHPSRKQLQNMVIIMPFHFHWCTVRMGWNDNISNVFTWTINKTLRCCEKSTCSHDGTNAGELWQYQGMEPAEWAVAQGLQHQH